MRLVVIAWVCVLSFCGLDGVSCKRSYSKYASFENEPYGDNEEREYSRSQRGGDMKMVDVYDPRGKGHRTPTRRHNYNHNQGRRLSDCRRSKHGYLSKSKYGRPFSKSKYGGGGLSKSKFMYGRPKDNCMKAWPWMAAGAVPFMLLTPFPFGGSTMDCECRQKLFNGEGVSLGGGGVSQGRRHNNERQLQLLDRLQQQAEIVSVSGNDRGLQFLDFRNDDEADDYDDVFMDYDDDELTELDTALEAYHGFDDDGVFYGDVEVTFCTCYCYCDELGLFPVFANETTGRWTNNDDAISEQLPDVIMPDQDSGLESMCGCIDLGDYLTEPPSLLTKPTVAPGPSDSPSEPIFKFPPIVLPPVSPTTTSPSSAIKKMNDFPKFPSAQPSLLPKLTMAPTLTSSPSLKKIDCRQYSNDKLIGVHGNYNITNETTFLNATSNFINTGSIYTLNCTRDNQPNGLNDPFKH